MIEQFSIEKLKEYGFPKNDIDRCQKRANYECFYDGGFKNMFFASKKQDKICSGIDGARQFHLLRSKTKITFPYYDLDLIPEYYETKLSVYLEERKRIGGNIFDEETWKEYFYFDEVAWTTEAIKSKQNTDITEHMLNNSPMSEIQKAYRNDQDDLHKIIHYQIWLNNLKNKRASEITQENVPVINAPKNEHPQPVYGLLHFYLSKTGEGEAINIENCQAIAKKYNFTSPTSGVALKNEFVFFKEDTNRLNLTEKMKTDKTKNGHFKTVIEILKKEKNTKSLNLAKDEYSIFFKKYTTQYNLEY